MFRGVILGFGLRDGDRRRALLVSSIAFGLWHIGAALHPERQRATGGVVGHQRAVDAGRGGRRRGRDDHRWSRVRLAPAAVGQHRRADDGRTPR